MKIAVLGATGKTGRYLVARLCEDGHDVTAIGRDKTRLAALDRRARAVRGDLSRPGAIKKSLAGAACVVSLAHARYTDEVLAALPASCRRVVLSGSTRVFGRRSDPAAEAVRAGEAAFRASGRAGVMIHPTMIYGAPDERNVNRVLRYLRRWPRAVPALVPLPAGGRRLVQPVFVDDVVAAFAAAITRRRAPGEPIIVAGPRALTYAELVRACAAALGRRVWVVPVPLWLMAGGARLLATLGLNLPVNAAELARAGEDKSFDISDMRERLGVTPRSFEDGLRLKLERGWV